MPRLLAIDWNEAELRAFVADVRGGRGVLQRAVANPIASLPADRQAAPGDTQAFASRLQAWIAEADLGRISTLVSVGRPQVELHEMSLPPAPADELPELVRFQMQRELASLDEDAPIDFLVLSGGETEQHSVLAAVVQADVVRQIGAVCDQAGVRLRRIVFRPCATASLARRLGTDPGGVQLVVHLVQNDVDMAVLAGDAVQLIRSVHLPGESDPAGAATALLREIRRTVVTARQQLGDRGIERVAICGSESRHAALADRVRDELQIPATVLDPFEVIALPPTGMDVSLEESARFAPHVGMVLDEANDTPPAFDFLNPRQRMSTQHKPRVYIAAAAAVLLLALWYAWRQYDRIASAGAEIARTQQQIDDQQPRVKVATSVVDRAEQIDAWVATDVVWLDEIDRLSKALRPKPLSAEDYPADDDIVAKKVVLEVRPRSQTAQISLEGVARRADAVPAFADRIRDAAHDIIPVHGDQSDKPDYQWEFASSVHIRPGQIAASSSRDADAADATSE